MAKAVARAQAGPKPGTQSYTYTKVTFTEEFDASGKIREHKRKIYQVMTKAGLSSARLVEVNGHPPAQADLKKQADHELSLRQILGEPKSARTANNDNFLTPELAERFEFSYLDEVLLNGRPTYRLSFQPKYPGLPVHRIVDRLLNRISGTLWIDAAEFELAQAEVQLRSEVDLLGGIAGCLRRLDYTLSRTRMAEGIWLNSFSSGDFEGRKLLESLHIRTKTQSTNFRPLA